MTGPFRFQSFGHTHPGTRHLNEDAFVNLPDIGLWAVADGVGGAKAGDVASSAISTALESLPAGLSAPAMLAELRGRLQSVHRTLMAMAARREPPCTIASTVVALISDGQYFACLWAGDSRAYLFRDGKLSQLTRDHSLVQAMIEEGIVSPAEADHHPQAHVITRAVGAGEADQEVQLDKVAGALLPGDRLLLCSDGISKTLSQAEMIRILTDPAVAEPSAGLVQAALSRQVTDNVTAVTVEVIGR